MGRGKGSGKGPRKGGAGKGKRKGGGGKGKRKGGGGPPRSGASRGSFAERRPTYAGAPPPLPDDPSAPFLKPAARPLVQVPLEFSSLRHWCDVIGNNILAEFWHVFKEARPCFSGQGFAAGDELIIENAPADGFTQHLLLIDRQPRIVSSQRILGVGRVALKLRGGGARSGRVQSVGYIGSYLAEFAAALELRSMPPRELTGPMRAILEPKVEQPGEYARRPINAASVPVNPSQRATIEGLRHALEKIQGPPGTGKSTTIFHILDSRVPVGQKVLVTCSRNVAVESIAQKLEGLDDWPLVVFGPRDRVGPTARQHLLDTQVGSQFDERRLSHVTPVVAERARELSAAIAAREAQCAGRRYEPLLRAFLRRRHAVAYALRDFCDRLSSYCLAASAAPDWCKQRVQVGKEGVLGHVKVFLCTIASTSRMLREWEEVSGEDLRVHTVVVDECGCTPESSTALLLRLRPANLIMVGDHKQLPPCSLVPPQVLEGTWHTRSLLERCVLASGKVHQLREQYRMHPSIGNLVSSLFYAGRLVTPLAVAQARKAREQRPLVWLDVQGREEAPERSYMNSAETTACAKVCTALRERVGDSATIALLTFYRGQLNELMHAIPSDLGIEVLTVDACQGSEFDYVVLSTVRANREGRLGFVKDQQRINVAISRSKLQLFVVGSRATLSSDADWSKVSSACSPALPQEINPKKALHTAASFVSVFDMLQQQKQREAAQKAAAALEEQEGRGTGGGKGGKGGGKSGGKGGGRSGGFGASADELMGMQNSFRSRTAVVRRNDGSYRCTGAAAAIGGGFRRRADVAELQARLSHHQASLEACIPRNQQNYRAPKTEQDFEEQFPDVGLGVALGVPDVGIGAGARAGPGRLPAARAGALRPSTRNDEKKARKTALRSVPPADASSQPGSSKPSAVGGQPPFDVGQAAEAVEEEDQWADVSEVMLFEMFPDDADAVEDALRRFAGLSHQAARALEALLARPSAKGKTVLDAEDDLDYDCAPADGSGAEDDDEALWDAGDDEAEGEEWAWAPDGCCAGCGEPAEGGFDGAAAAEEDGLLYCGWCWAEWAADAADAAAPSAAAVADASAPAADAAAPPFVPGASRHPARHEAPGLLPRAAPGLELPPAVAAAGEAPARGAPAPRDGPPAPRWQRSAGARAASGAAAEVAEASEAAVRPPPPPVPRGGAAAPGAEGPEVKKPAQPARAHEPTRFFEGLYAQPAQPARPARAREPASTGSRFFEGLDGRPKWAEAPTRPEAGGKELVALAPKEERGLERQEARAIAAVQNPAEAARARAAARAQEPQADRCRRLLASVEPAVEADVVDYITSLVDDDPEEAREAALEILEGHGVPEAAREAFWEALAAGA